ncbi:MAG: cell division protein ZapA [Acidobacteriota bacterium]|nr:cell division protein ZapA [Blastocatellia bacterium]MDW8239279.1 cell division protein ZapA [Acidobacteriota bacterium]
MDDSTTIGDAPPSPQAITVEIYNQSYNIRGNGDREYIAQLAEFVDRRMRDIAGTTHTVDSLKVAILAALHIADELHQLKKRHEQMDAQILQKAIEYSDLMDQIIGVKANEAASPEDTQPHGLNQS